MGVCEMPFSVHNVTDEIRTLATEARRFALCPWPSGAITALRLLGSEQRRKPPCGKQLSSRGYGILSQRRRLRFFRI